MKTFKLVSLIVETEEATEKIELLDGLIISQENSKRTWIIEAYCEKKHMNFFQSQLYDGNDIDTKVVITRKENNPATFQARIISIKPLEYGITVLMHGVMRQNSNDYSEKVLSDLVEAGLSGNELLRAFSQQIKQK